MLLCAQEERFSRYGRGGHEAIVETIRCEDGRFGIGLEDEGLALFAKEVEPSIGIQR